MLNSFISLIPTDKRIKLNPYLLFSLYFKSGVERGEKQYFLYNHDETLSYLTKSCNIMEIFNH